jgi:hypothetical protein
MRALQVYYITKALHFSPADASLLFGAYTAGVYLTPIFGGLIADRWLGRRKAVILGGALMALGHFMMAFESLFFPAMVVIALGNGLFLPNLPSQINLLYLLSCADRPISAKSGPMLRPKQGNLMALYEGELVVKNGTFLYDGTVTCDVRIILSQVRHGSGDLEDPPELADDKEGEFFYVQYGSTTERGHFNASGGGGATMEEAIAVAESASGIGKTVQWFD